MKNTDPNNSNIEDRPYEIKLDDSIEILTTDDERLKIIGEELSNDTGRAILTKLFDGYSKISDIATDLNLSIPLVSWHIHRLTKIGLVRVADIKLSSKNKKTCHYLPTKVVLVIIPSQVSNNNHERHLLRILSKKLYDKLSTIIAFVGSSLSLYLIQKFMGVTHVSLSDPEAATSQSSEFLIPLIGGCTVTAIFVLIRLWEKRKSELLKK